MTTETRLPEAFPDLEDFQAWILETQRERRAKRLRSSMEEIQSFYDAISPRIQAILKSLDSHPLDRLPEPERRLYLLTLAWVEITSAVELYKQPHIIEAVDPARFQPVEEPRS